MVLNDLHCVAITHVSGSAAGHNTQYHISRFLKGGYQTRDRREDKSLLIPKGSSTKLETLSRLTGDV